MMNIENTWQDNRIDTIYIKLIKKIYQQQFTGSGVGGQRSEIGGQRFKVQSSTVKVVKVFDFESNAEFIRALKLAERACTENELPRGKPWGIKISILSSLLQQSV